MTFHEKFTLKTKGFCDVHDVTEKVKKIVEKSKIKNGVVVVGVTGSTAGVTTLEYEPGLKKDLKEAFDRLVPQNSEYAHNAKWGDGNGFSHIRSSLLGMSVSVALVENQLQLGTWQQLVVVDFDNRDREREVVVQVLGD